ncbi:MAG: response regulator [gamma proteobacterium symbiont of Bathyaustriella thionipta]|nr:response regulator [gamma proteobacterium symbiont of Bathyaustriella thionipta]MCU7951696.1 response regulator [gamma proteobacterium symbiont of Bathyaustriella thionipta]MCU7953991.1 response regulator [gamma proteobacterium symbiont of Bathyaustriella thionipta]MCU7958300.1 response regulator [gamma proteobacterium symbiont of Bathyaustriella thionipta]MCU7968941.1 response regulator [gamma proteobacterium symbiont of Bathyaustriella thionipta]
MKKIKILIVDDASFMRDIVRKGVRSMYPGFITKEAADGSQAKSLLKQEDFELILCDWEMPEMTGEELLAWIRHEGPNKETPFVMITSRGDKEHVVKALSLKANNYIVKPFTNEKLTDVVSKQLMLSLGIKIDELRKLGANAGSDMSASNDAMSLLTVNTSQTSKNSNVVNVNTAKQTEKSARPREQSIAQLRWKDLTTKCLIKEITMSSVTAVIRGDANIPSIMEPVVFDLVTNNGEDISRINGYTYQLQAREASAESEFINITIRFVDDNDPDKQAHLERYIDSFN